MDVGIMMQLGNFDIMTTFIDIYDYLHILIAVRFTTGGSACVLTPFVGFDVSIQRLIRLIAPFLLIL